MKFTVMSPSGPRPSVGEPLFKNDWAWNEMPEANEINAVKKVSKAMHQSTQTSLTSRSPLTPVQGPSSPQSRYFSAGGALALRHARFSPVAFVKRVLQRRCQSSLTDLTVSRPGTTGLCGRKNVPYLLLLQSTTNSSELTLNMSTIVYRQTDQVRIKLISIVWSFTPPVLLVFF